MSKTWKAFERDTGKTFSLAYYPGNDGEFRRTSAFAQSGGWGKGMAGGDLVATKYGYGEEIFIDKSFPFSIECKNWRQEGVKHFFSGLYSAESVIFEWMDQSITDAEKFNKMPLVVFRLFRQKSIAMLVATDFAKLKELFGEPEFKYYFLRRYPAGDEENAKPNLLVFVLLKDFISWIDWEVYKFASRNFIRSVVKT